MHARADSSLASLQARMTAALLAADPEGQRLAPELFCGAHPGSVGLRVYRNTVLSAISNALRTSYVAVERLVGEEFFDRMAIEYARGAPPSAPQLDAYGSGFAAYIDGFPGTEKLPYLSALAHLDWQLGELGRLRRYPDGGPQLSLEGGVRLRFAAPLRTHRAQFAVDQLRAAILAEDLEALRAISLEPGDHYYALFRTEAGVNVRSLSAASARFLDAALSGADGAAALAAAAAVDQSVEELAARLASEILPPGFVRVESAHPP
ncbi:MAG TPA: DNA-binding domain-containing protein [Steroidobacteraceae bacterium]|nr:DNA-binding domain-containing protein [Steroidobacteraceae bacterium]